MKMYLNRNCNLLLKIIVIQCGKLASKTVMDGLCESVLAAILTPAVFCISAIGQSGPCGFGADWH